MRLSVKILLGLWVFLFLIVGGLVYSTYSKLHPEAFVALLTEQVQHNYPGAKLEVGEVNYNLSLNFNLSLKNVTLKRSDKVLGTLGEIELKVPWWLLVVNRGNAQINLSNLNLFIEPSRSEKEEGLSNSSSKVVENSKVEVSLPQYLQDVQYTIRARNISIKDISGSRTLLKLSKLLVREFHYGKNSAFELKLPISIGHRGMNYSSELWLFGDVTPEKAIWNFNYRGNFRTKDMGENVQFDDVVLEGKTRFKPREVDIQSEVEFSIDKKNIGSGAFAANEKKITLNLMFTQLPTEFLNIFENELRHTHLSKLVGSAAGELHLERKLSETKATLRGGLEFNAPFQLNKEEIMGAWKLSFDNTRWDSSFISPKGEVSFFRRSVIDLDNGQVKQYSEELGFTGVNLPMALGTVPSLKELMSFNSTKYFSSHISIKKCLMGEKEVDGYFKIGVSPDLKFYQGELTQSEAQKFKLVFNQSRQKKLNIHFDNFFWSNQLSFLSPYFQADSGTLDGQIEGRWKEDWADGKWVMKLKASDLVNGTGSILDMNKKFWSEFNIPTDNISHLNALSYVQDGKLKLDSLIIEGEDPIKLSGLINFEIDQNSHLILSYPKNKKWKPVKKEFKGVFLKKEEG